RSRDGLNLPRATRPRPTGPNWRAGSVSEIAGSVARYATVAQVDVLLRRHDEQRAAVLADPVTDRKLPFVGIGQDGRALFIMPSQEYVYLSDREIADLVAY